MKLNFKESKKSKLSGKEVAESALNVFQNHPHDVDDPSAWNALFLDRAIPFDVGAKAAYIKQCQGKSRQFALPLIRPFCRLAITLIAVWKTFFPNLLNSPRTLHYLIYLGQKYFVSPEANYIILRHFNIGTRIIRFICANLHRPDGKLVALEPTELADIHKLGLYVQHDLNLFNFVIHLNRDMQEQKTQFTPNTNLNLSMIELSDFGIRDLPNRWSNLLDCETAIELYTPLFYLLLRDSDFWRAHHSLQFDETIAIYVARILGSGNHLALLNNKHPMSPRPGYESAPRLVLHGLASEYLYGMLAAYKRRQENPDQDLPMTFDNELQF